MNEEDARNQDMEHTEYNGAEQTSDSQPNGAAENSTETENAAENRSFDNRQDDGVEYRYHNTQEGREEKYRRNNSSNYNFKTPEYGRDNYYGQNSESYGDGRDGRSYYNGQNNYGPRGPQNRPPRKHSGFGRELGHFAAKAAIAAVIGVAALALAGTIALNATNKNVYIVDKNKQVTIGNSNNGGGSGFPFGSFGFGGQGGNSDNGGNSSGNEGNDGDNSQSQQSDNDGPKLGIKVETMPDKLAKAGYPEGVLVAEVTKGGAADKAGLKTGDVITAFNGTVVKTADDLVEQVQNVKAGDTVKVNYKRMENGTFKAYDADVTFSEQSGSSETESGSDQSASSDAESQNQAEGTESN